MRVGVNLLFLIPSEVGGSETHAVEVLRAVCIHFPSVNLVLFANRENHRALKQGFEKFPQVEICLLNFKARNRWMRVLREQAELPVKASAYSLDLLFSPGYTAPYFTRLPQILFLHDMQYQSFPASFKTPARLAMHYLIKLGTQKSKAVMTPSEFSKKEVMKYTSVPSGRIYVARHGAAVEFARTPESAGKTERLYRIPGLRTPYILCVGFSNPQKNLPCLVEAFKGMLGDIPHQLVLVGGKGRGEKALVRALKGLPVDRFLRLQGIPREQLITLYHGADVFVLPTLYEGFGLPVLEAMTAETPVITTRCGAIEEFAGDSVTYFNEKSVEDLQAKITEVLRWNPAVKYARLSEAKKRAEEFTWERAAEKTVECFGAVLGRKPREGAGPA